MFLRKTIRKIEIAHYWSISLDITLWNVNRKEILRCNAILVSVAITQSYRQSFLAFATANLSIISSKTDIIEMCYITCIDAPWDILGLGVRMGEWAFARPWKLGQRTKNILENRKSAA